MSYCQTCGKELRDSTEEILINGLVQCEKCAYGEKFLNAVNNQKQPENTQRSASGTQSKRNFWLELFSLVALGSLFAGCVLSIIVAAIVSDGFEEGGGLAVMIAIVGIVISIGLYGFKMVLLNVAKDISAIREKMDTRL